MTNRIKSPDGLERVAKLFYNNDGEKLSSSLVQAVDIHLGQLKTLSKVKSSFCSLQIALPPPSDDQSSPTEEVQQFNNQHLDRVLKVDEFVSRWDWRIGLVALMGVANGRFHSFPFLHCWTRKRRDQRFNVRLPVSPITWILLLKSYLVD